MCALNIGPGSASLKHSANYMVFETNVVSHDMSDNQVQFQACKKQQYNKDYITHDISALTGRLITENISLSVSLQSMCKCQQ